MKHPSFILVTQVLSIFESLLSFSPALILGILELDLLSLLIQILSLLGSTILLPFGWYFYQVWAMILPQRFMFWACLNLSFILFFGIISSLFAENENLQRYIQWKWNWKWRISRNISQPIYLPKLQFYNFPLGAFEIADPLHFIFKQNTPILNLPLLLHEARLNFWPHTILYLIYYLLGLNCPTGFFTYILRQEI